MYLGVTSAMVDVDGVWYQLWLTLCHLPPLPLLYLCSEHGLIEGSPLSLNSNAAYTISHTAEQTAANYARPS